MPSQVIMPKLSDAMTEGRLLQWLKKEGIVSRVAMSWRPSRRTKRRSNWRLRSACSGRSCGRGDMVPVGKLIAIVAEPDEDISRFSPGRPASLCEGRNEGADRCGSPAPSAPPKSEAKYPRPRQPRGGAGLDSASPSPAAWRASQRGSGQDRGSGPGGRILERTWRPLAAQAQGKGGADVRSGRGSSRTRSSAPSVRPSRAHAAEQGAHPALHVTVEADMGAAQELRTALNAVDPPREAQREPHSDQGGGAGAESGIRHQRHLSRRQGAAVQSAHIGVAVALEDGLIVPVIRECERRAWARSPGRRRG